MNLDEKISKMKPEHEQLICDLKRAYEEIIAAKLAMFDVAKKHAPLCIQIIKEFYKGKVPKLNGNVVEAQRKALDGLNDLHEEFWASDVMIEGLWECVENEFIL